VTTGDRATFYKMTGSGNDFVMLDGRAHRLGEWPAERIVATCNRRLGVGADGLVLLTPLGIGEVRFDFFNSDGSRASMCGNAALCSTRLAARLGMAPTGEVRLRTDAGLVRGRCLPGPDRAEINLEPFDLPVAVPGIAFGPGERQARFAVVGVPHLVVLVDDVDAVPLESRGRELRFHPALGAAGANANFISAPRSPGAPWRIRTYERGVEGETLACGTGTVAAALVVAELTGQPLPIDFVSRAGLELGVRAAIRGGTAEDVWLAGQGRLVFTGTFPD